MRFASYITFIILWTATIDAEPRGLGRSKASIAGQQSRSPLYSPIGKRDPFLEPRLNDGGRSPDSVARLARVPIGQLTLRAILRGLGKPKAMFEDPDGMSYILEEGNLIGRERGTISRILNSDVIITERTFNYLGEETLYERVLSIPEE